MSSFFTWVSQFLTNFQNFVLNLFKAVFEALWDMGYDFLCFIFEQLFATVVAIVGAIPAPSVNFQSYLAGGPAETLNMMATIRIPEAVGIVITSLGIRFLLQLIPFVRLGS